jgi:hypothetical protein
MSKARTPTWKFVKPLTKRRARKRMQRAGEAARGLAMTVKPYAPGLAGTIDSVLPRPKRSRLAPRIGARAVLVTGAVLGASAVYLLEPKAGREHRRALRRLVK